MQNTPTPPPSTTPQPDSTLKQIAQKMALPLKIGAILLIVLLLLWPTAMVEDLIRGRISYKQEALSGQDGIYTKWAGKQNLVGPIISIPYYTLTDPKNNSDKPKRIKEYFHLLPDELTIKGHITPIKKHRGIFETVVYSSEITLQGSFNNILQADPNLNVSDLVLSQAVVSFGLSDLKGISEQLALNWQPQPTTDSLKAAAPTVCALESGLGTSGLKGSGLYANIDLTQAANHNYHFDMSIKLNGAEALLFSPIGRTTQLQLKSTWPHLALRGAFCRKALPFRTVALWPTGMYCT